MRRPAASLAAAAFICVLALPIVAGQQPTPSGRADDVFKNVQLLKGITVGEFIDTMGLFSAALGANCVHCHVEESLTHWEKFAEDVPRKRRARQMIQMVNAINQANFGGRQMVTCYTCHHGDIRPDGKPSLLAQTQRSCRSGKVPAAATGHRQAGGSLTSSHFRRSA